MLVLAFIAFLFVGTAQAQVPPASCKALPESPNLYQCPMPAAPPNCIVAFDALICNGQVPSGQVTQAPNCAWQKGKYVCGLPATKN